VLTLGLTPAEKTALLAELRSSAQRMRVRVKVLDRDEKVIQSLDAPAGQIVSGSIDVDATADVTRSLDLELLDERHALGFDVASPAKAGLFADNFVAVERGVFVDTLSRWIDVPVFWGPLTNFSREGDRVKLEGQGKEALGLSPHFATQGYTIRKGRRVDDAIRDVMDRIGETRYALPDMGARLPRHAVVEPDEEPWRVVKFGWEAEDRVIRGKGKNRHKERVTVDYNGLVSLAGNMNLFYNGNGRLAARRRSRDPVLVLEEGRDLSARPVPRFDALAARNTVVVTGAKITRGKKPNRHHVQMRATVTLKSTHPLSTKSLARNGKPRHLTEFITADNLKTRAACRARGERVLREKSQDGLELAFECLPFPLLEELDTVRVRTDEYQLDVVLKRFTIPLDEGLMSIGWDR
jgi:hypothetical protein